MSARKREAMEKERRSASVACKHVRDRTMKTLILGPSETKLGGVASFLESLTPRFSRNVEARRFIVGRRQPGQTTARGMVLGIRDFARLTREARFGDYDIVHVNPSANWRSLVRDGAFVVLIGRVGCRRTVAFFHGWHAPTVEAVKRSRWLRRLFRNVFSRCHQVGVLSASFKDDLVEIGLDPSRITLFTTMFDPALFANLPGKDGPGFTLLFLGRIIREKGVYELLDGFLDIKAKYPGARLVFVGDGPDRAGIEAVVGQRGLEGSVRVTGYLDGADKATALAGADIFVFPSYYGEGRPVALLEAMAAGLAVVSTRAGGIPEIIRDGEHGVLLDSPRPQAIVAAVDRLFARPDWLARVQAHNRAEAWRKYEAGVVARQVEQIYRRVLDS